MQTFTVSCRSCKEFPEQQFYFLFKMCLVYFLRKKLTFLETCQKFKKWFVEGFRCSCRGNDFCYIYVKSFTLPALEFCQTRGKARLLKIK